jgi:hypothetical protein
MSESASGNITKINNVLNGFENKIEKTESDLKDCANQVRLAQEQLEKPFEQEGELAEKSARLTQLNLELNINNHNGGMDEEDELTLSENEEYDFQAELAENGIEESELFNSSSRHDDDFDEVAASVGQELSEQGKRDELLREIESGAMLDIGGVYVKETVQDSDVGQEQDQAVFSRVLDGFAGMREGKPPTSADLDVEKMNLENYSKFQYPKAAQFIDIHDPREQHADELIDGNEGIYRLLVEGIVNTTLQEHKIAEQSLNPRSSNDEYHYIRDYAMTKVCKGLELPDFPMPKPVGGLSGTDMATLREKGEELAVLSLYGHLPQAERDGAIRADVASRNETGEGKIAGIASIANYAEERKAIIAEAKRKLAEDGAMPIITDAMEGRAYSGEIVEIGSDYAVQKIDEGRGIIHNLRYLKDFTRVLNESNVPYLEITYDREMNGSVGLNETAEHGRSVAMGR